MKHLSRMLVMLSIVALAMACSSGDRVDRAAAGDSDPLVVAVTAPVSAATEPQPVAMEVEPAATTAAQPAAPPVAGLPSGHPDISALVAQRAAAAKNLPAGHPPIPQPAAAPGAGELPAGHPPIPQPAAAPGAGELPAGHPPIPQPGAAPGAGALPAGHPDLSATTGAPAAGAAGGGEDACCPEHGAAPTAVISKQSGGALTIRANQGTAGGPAVGAEAIVVELHGRQGLIRKIETALDEHGIVIIEDLPIDLDFQPVVKLAYAGIEYEAVGEPMGPKSQVQEIPVDVYLTTDQRPDWQIHMRHVMVQPHDQWLHVTEIIALENPGDRTWVGSQADKTTFVLPIPAAAQQVQVVGGFHACCMQVEPGRIVNPVGMLPGQSQYQLHYMLPVSDGAAELTIAAPVVSRQLAVFMPDDGSTVVAGGLEAMGAVNMGENRSRMFRAGSVAANQVVSLQVSNIAAIAAQPEVMTAGGSELGSQVMALVGIGLTLLLGGAYIFTRPVKAAAARK